MNSPEQIKDFLSENITAKKYRVLMMSANVLKT